MKLLKTENALNSQSVFYLPKNSFGGFVVFFSVDAKTGITLTRSDFGNVIVNWNGQDVVNVDLDFLNRFSNVYGGYSHFESTVSGTAKLFAFIPTSLFNDKNVYHVSEQDRVLFQLNFSTLSANIDSGSVSVYGIMQDGIQNYLYNIIQRPIAVSGSGVLADNYLLENVAQIFLKDSAGLLDRVQYAKDNKILIEATKQELNYYSDFIHKLESDVDFIAIDLFNSSDYREVLSKSISYNHSFLTSGTLQQYFAFLKFDNQKTVESYYSIKQNFEAKMQETSISKPIVKSSDLKNISSEN